MQTLIYKIQRQPFYKQFYRVYVYIHIFIFIRFCLLGIGFLDL